MRVLHVVEATGSGTLHVVRSLAAGLAAAGHEVAIACGRRPETPADLRGDLPSGVIVRALPWSRRTVRSQLEAARALRALARDWEPDIVHLHSSFAGAVGAIALPRRTAFVYTPHGAATARTGDSALRLAAYRQAERAIARRASLVGAVSEAEARVAREWARAQQVTVVRNGIGELDPGAQPVTNGRSAGPLVLAAGRICAQHRPADSARILSALRDRSDVAWVGAAPDGEDAPLHHAGVPITGWLPREEVLARLGYATVYLHWSAWDGLSLTVLEAMARDAVVVASDIPPNRELLGERQICGKEERAVALIRRVLDDQQLRHALLADQRARRVAYGAARMTEAWASIYRRVLVAANR